MAKSENHQFSTPVAPWVVLVLALATVGTIKAEAPRSDAVIPGACPVGEVGQLPPAAPQKTTVDRGAGAWIPTVGALQPSLRGPRRAAAPGAGEDRAHWRKNLFKRVVSDQKFLFTTWTPLEFRRPSMFVPLLAVGAGAIDSSRNPSGLDLQLSQSISRWGAGNVQGAAEAFTLLGDGTTGIVLVGGTYLISRWSGHTRMSRASSLSAEALVNTAIWSSVLKRATRRARPGAMIRGEFLVSDPSVESTSFPSGHALGAFAVAAVFAGEYRDKRWVPWLAYGTAGLIGTSRIALGRHYVSDVIVGGLLGRSLGRMVMTREKGLEGGSIVDRFEPIFEPEEQRYGLAYRHSW